MEPLLKVRGLRTTFRAQTRKGSDAAVQAVRSVDFQLGRGETVGVVGESGSGKSVTALSLIDLLPDTARVEADVLTLDGASIAGLSRKQLRALRGRRIAMVFQDPMTSLNPLMRIGRQLDEMIAAHDRTLTRRQRRERVIELLKEVRIPEPERRYRSYPHEFSGGMRQRAMIAMAMALRPEILVADEPTTALDVTIQDQILRLMRRLQDENGTSILLITHDLAVVAGLCSRVIVMYGGLIMEEAPTEKLFAQPMHPYTMGLLASLPALRGGQGDRLESIPGSPPDMTDPGEGCPFAPRCKYARVRCEQARPPYYSVGEYSPGAGHRSMCWLLDPEAPGADSPFGEAGGALRGEVAPLGE
ncbi:MAG: ABC transporter ATP-binding protein [Bifidobacteriaceae bacterium]|nr:ABC transporter ATP-binding protein [Bifidobacteriaceae bacterium]